MKIRCTAAQFTCLSLLVATLKRKVKKRSTIINCRYNIGMARYGKKAQEKIAKTMREYKHGTLKSDRSGVRVKSRKQAIAIGLSKARKSGAKVPRRR